MLTPATLFKCLSDDTRLHATLLLNEENELCVCELVESLALKQPKVSRHLAQLKNCGVLFDRRQDQWIFYRINPELPDWASAVIRQAALGCRGAIDEMKTKLNKMDNRPERCC